MSLYQTGIKVRNTGTFTNTNNIKFAAETQLEVWLDVNMTNKTYSTWVKTSTMSYPGLIFANAGFRKTAVDSIARWSVMHNGTGEPDTLKNPSVDFVTSIPGLDVSTLDSISLTVAALSKKFDAASKTYTVILPVGTTTVSVTGNPSAIGSKVTGNGAIDVSSGSATASIVDTSFDKSSTTTYTVNFEVRALASDSVLSGLSLSTGTLDPVFDAATLTYNVAVPFGTGIINITPTSHDPNATVSGDATVDVTSGTATATAIVTAEDGIASTSYTINFSIIPQSTDASLSALSISAGTLAPVFNPTVLNYTVSVPNGTTSVDVTATPNNVSETLTGVGSVDVSSGSGTATIVVTAEDGITTQTYTIAITVTPLSTDATLSGISLGTGSLAPAFNAAILAYAVTVAHGTTSVSVTSTPNDANATVSGNGNVDVSSGSGKATLVVTAENGTSTKTYTVTITVAPSDDATLSSLTFSAGTLSPVFSSSVTSYSVLAPVGTTNVTVSAATNDANASATGAGGVDVSSGSGVATIIVTAENGNATKTYTVNITVELSTDASLSSLTVDAGTLTPVFSADVTSYTLLVPFGTASVNIAATANYASATISGQGSVNVSAGSGTSTVVVTAQDGVAKTTYTIDITVESNVGISDHKSSVANVYPTISSGSFNIKFENAPGKITVYDLIGKTIVSKNAASALETVDVAVSGVYFIKVESEGKSNIFKVIRTN